MIGRGGIWTHFILAAAVARSARAVTDRASADEAEVPFCYADTHGGRGRLRRTSVVETVLAAEAEFGCRWFHDAVRETDCYPGSWVLAGRVVADLPRAVFEADVNDHDPQVIDLAKANRENGWVRFWSHDWFLFLRNRISMPSRPHFVFIDPPADDHRGPGYAIDAAILLDTLGIPYMVSYAVDDPQDPIDQIGRSGLELWRGEWGFGVMLGGGAEAVVLDVLGDLKRLADVLEGDFTMRLPKAAASDDYII
ncbi:hypothetical protein A6A04_04325 [Paramagnetospirillum marisnigri]|uniref:Methyltransferase n=1 Tax=Paramagnetospirillum marisnigri TaxID=1285242 RepID=A0A178MH27_9PROT|nr:hypothetical protein [Paramagnetospirillum marisnigri]OAN47992.1 hypothetical protein A6A04_04325 [Paramagnetospirillum marisnigri]